MSAPPNKATSTWSQKILRLCSVLTQFIVILLAAADLVFMSGVIERRLIPWVSAWTTGARVVCQFDGLRPLRLRALRVYDASAAAGMPPLLQGDLVTVGYRLAIPVAGTRLFPNIDLWGIQIHADGRRPEYTNYMFLSDYVTGDGGEADITIVTPERVMLHDLTVYVAAPEWAMTIAGLDIEARLDDLEHFSAMIRGDTVRSGWHGEGAIAGLPPLTGRINASVSRRDMIFDFAAQVRLPDFLVLEGDATVGLGDMPHLALKINHMRLAGPVFGDLISTQLPAPVQFGSVLVEPLYLNASLIDGTPRVSEAQIDARVEALKVGDAETPWYSGDLRIEATGEHVNQSQATMTATLNHGQVITGTLLTKDSGGRISLSLDNWSHEQVAALWPAPFETWKQWLPEIKRMDGVLACDLDDGNLRLSADMRLGTVVGPASSVHLSGVYDQDGHIHAQTNIALGTAVIEATVSLPRDTGLNVAAKIGDLDIATAMRLFTPGLPHENVSAVIDGTFDLAQKENSLYQYTAAFRSDMPGYGAWSLPESLSPVTVTGAGDIAADVMNVTANNLDITLHEAATLAISDFSYDAGTLTATATVNGDADLAPFGAWFGFGDLWGHIHVNGNMLVAGFDKVALTPLRVALDPLGYDMHSIPYGSTFMIETPLEFNLADLALDAGPLLATLGDDTRIALDAASITAADGPNINIDGLVFGTGFAPLVAKQYLVRADGKFELTAPNIQYDGAELTGTAAYHCHAPRLLVFNNLADIHGLVAQGTVTAGPRPESTGNARIEELLTAGVTLRGVDGAMRFEDMRLAFDDITLDLFGGGVTAQAEVMLFEPGMPITLRGEARNIDLSIFTQEFEPPSLILTGQVNGMFAVGITAMQLHMLDVDLEATEGFSMNRDMVEQLLMQQYMDDITGGGRMSRVLRDVIGDRPQRPFDHVRMLLGLEDGRITGYTRLESGALNLTVDITADPEALLDALRIRQEQAS